MKIYMNQINELNYRFDISEINNLIHSKFNKNYK